MLVRAPTLQCIARFGSLKKTTTTTWVSTFHIWKSTDGGQGIRNSPHTKSLAYLSPRLFWCRRMGTTPCTSARWDCQTSDQSGAVDICMHSWGTSQPVRKKKTCWMFYCNDGTHAAIDKTSMRPFTRTDFTMLKVELSFCVVYIQSTQPKTIVLNPQSSWTSFLLVSTSLIKASKRSYM